jgi:SIR2-like domain
MDTQSLFTYIKSRAQEGKLAILCGAGISVDSPSNKPLGDDLKNLILNHLAARCKDNHAGSKSSLEKIIVKTGWNIESYLEDIFSGENSSPNSWHYLIAKLVKSGMIKCVFTTNFDPLINKALQEEGLESPRDFDIVSLETYDFPDDEDTSNLQKPTIFYLHGTHEAWNMTVTINHILDPSLSYTRLKPILNFLTGKDRTLLVLGYSGRDLDIENELAKIQNLHAEIIWIRRGEWEFKKLEEYFSRFKGVKVHNPNYTKFINQLLEQFEIDYTVDSLNKNSDEFWKKQIASWADKLPSEAAVHIFGRIREINDENTYQTNKIIIRLKDDLIKIVGKFVFINPKSENGMVKMLDCDATHGTLAWPVFVRRVCSSIRQNHTEVINHLESTSLTSDLCNMDEKELLFYVEEHIKREKMLQKYYDDPNYRSFINKANDLLTSHTFLHSLTNQLHD